VFTITFPLVMVAYGEYSLEVVLNGSSERSLQLRLLYCPGIL